MSPLAWTPMRPSVSARQTSRAGGALAAVLAIVAAAAAMPAAAASAAGKPIMTREELRSCMKLNDSVKQRTDALQAEDRKAQGEREALQREGEELSAAVATLDRTSQEAVDAHNAKAQARDAKVQAWNDGNRQRQERASTIDQDRQRWQSDCASRRFREDDEIAIKRGK